MTPRQRFITHGAAAFAAAAAWMLTASVASADPLTPAPTPPPSAPNCLTYGGQPFPHMRLLPCGWDWDGTHWTHTAAAPITPTNLAELLGAQQ
jgi:hypothetical protein